MTMPHLFTRNRFSNVRHVAEVWPDALAPIRQPADGALRQSDWFVFDVDHVLTQPADPACQRQTLERYWYHSIRALLGLTRAQKDVAFTLLVSLSRSTLIESDAPATIRALQDAGASCIALTSALCGRVGAIDDVARWRVDELRQLGIDFARSAPRGGPQDYPQYGIKGGYSPCYREGVLFTHGQYDSVSKGELLAHFLQHNGLPVESLTFIDDSTENLESVRSNITRQYPSVPLRCLRFTGHHPVDPTIPVASHRQTWRQLAQAAREQTRAAAVTD